MREGAGKVYLIGAGPGDPGLFTVKGVRCLEKADVVLYDALANPRLLTHVKPGAELIYVGKRGGQHALPQDEIGRLLVERAGAGKIVARLKGGDPFIFGRGGEEAEELVTAGIPFEVVPGVTSAVAAPAYAGIPLTHRDFTSTVAFVTGHEDPTKEDTSIAWDKIATGVGTLVFFMGVGRLPEIVRQLVDHGRAPETPAAVIRWGTRADQVVVTGTLATLVERAGGIKPPGADRGGGGRSAPRKTSLVRGCAALWETDPGHAGARASQRPYPAPGGGRGRGRRVPHHPDRAAGELGAAGRRDRPTARVPMGDLYERQRRAVLLGSAAAASDETPATSSGSRSAPSVRPPRRRSANEGVRADVVPDEFKAEGLVDAVAGRLQPGARVLLARAAEAREVLPEELIRRGALVDVVSAYRTIKAVSNADEVRGLLQEGKIHAVTFTSSSTVKHFLDLVGSDGGVLLRDVVVASIGPITAETAARQGIVSHVVPESYTIPALADALVRHFQAARPTSGPE